jgi:hypothetical protein
MRNDVLYDDLISRGRRLNRNRVSIPVSFVVGYMPSTQTSTTQFSSSGYADVLSVVGSPWRSGLRQSLPEWRLAAQSLT